MDGLFLNWAILLSSQQSCLMLSSYASRSNFLFLFLIVPSHLTLIDVQFQRSTSIANVPLILPSNPTVETLYRLYCTDTYILNWHQLWFDKPFFITCKNYNVLFSIYINWDHLRDSDFHISTSELFITIFLDSLTF